ncbi:hypothetical protein TNCV_299081 [Trichonephila clavipes]|nr:hypothetical protein TNCV_299081 [Trichonephila clavipes]
MVLEEHCHLGRCQKNGFNKQRGVMDKCVQRLDENLGAIRFQTGRECICVFRTNRTLMRPRAVGRLWWSATEKGRVVDPPLVFKRDFLGDGGSSVRESWRETCSETWSGDETESDSETEGDFFGGKERP